MSKWSNITIYTAQGPTSSFPKLWLDSYTEMLGSDIRMFLPFIEKDPPTTGAKITDFGPKGHHFTNETAFDTDPYLRGKMLAYIFNGTDEALSMADHADFTFGNALADSAFSLGAWVNFKDATSSTIMSRRDDTTGSTEKEWMFYTDSADKIVFMLYDDSHSAYIARKYNTALAENTWLFLVGTYDATEAVTGINVYMNGTPVDDTNASSGTYTAMEDQAVVTAIGYYENSAGSKTDYFDGHMWGPFIVAEELSADAIASLYKVGKWLLGL